MERRAQGAMVILKGSLGTVRSSLSDLTAGPRETAGRKRAQQGPHTPQVCPSPHRPPEGGPRGVMLRAKLPLQHSFPQVTAHT